MRSLPLRLKVILIPLAALFLLASLPLAAPSPVQASAPAFQLVNYESGFWLQDNKHTPDGGIITLRHPTNDSGFTPDLAKYDADGNLQWTLNKLPANAESISIESDKLILINNSALTYVNGAGTILASYSHSQIHSGPAAYSGHNSFYLTLSPSSGQSPSMIGEIGPNGVIWQVPYDYYDFDIKALFRITSDKFVAFGYGRHTQELWIREYKKNGIVDKEFRYKAGGTDMYVVTEAIETPASFQVFADVVNYDTEIHRKISIGLDKNYRIQKKRSLPLSLYQDAFIVLPRYGLPVEAGIGFLTMTDNQSTDPNANQAVRYNGAGAQMFSANYGLERHIYMDFNYPVYEGPNGGILVPAISVNPELGEGSAFYKLTNGN